MRPLTVPDAENVILALQDEIRCTDASRYDHRLHALLLVAQGLTPPQVRRLLGDSTQSVQYWVRQFDEEGLAGLAEGVHPGRPVPPPCPFVQLRGLDLPGWLRGVRGETEAARGRAPSGQLEVGG